MLSFLTTIGYLLEMTVFKPPSAQWLKAGPTKQSSPHNYFSCKVKKLSVLMYGKNGDMLHDLIICSCMPIFKPSYRRKQW